MILNGSGLTDMVEIRLHESKQHEGTYDSEGVVPDVGDVVRLRYPDGRTQVVQVRGYIQRGTGYPIVRYEKINDLVEGI